MSRKKRKPKKNHCESDSSFVKYPSNLNNNALGRKRERNKSGIKVTEMEVLVDPMMIVECCWGDEEKNQDADDKSKSNTDHSYAIKNLSSHNNDDNAEYVTEVVPDNLDANLLGDDDRLDDRFICPICGKYITRRRNLKYHLETHKPKGRYGCDICGRIFRTQYNFYRHKEYHGSVEYTCGVCGLFYNTCSTLRAHSIAHSDLRPYKCPWCDNAFKRNQDLKFHLNRHTGIKPYQCPFCPKSFTTPGNRSSHRKRMHSVEDRMRYLMSVQPK